MVLPGQYGRSSRGILNYLLFIDNLHVHFSKITLFFTFDIDYIRAIIQTLFDILKPIQSVVHSRCPMIRSCSDYYTSSKFSIT